MKNWKLTNNVRDFLSEPDGGVIIDSNRGVNMAKEEKDIESALNQFKDTMKDLKKKNMYDHAVDKYERDKKEKKKNPFDKEE